MPRVALLRRTYKGRDAISHYALVTDDRATATTFVGDQVVQTPAVAPAHTNTNSVTGSPSATVP